MFAGGVAVGTALVGSVDVAVGIVVGVVPPIEVSPRRGRLLLLSGRPLVLFEGPFLKILRLLLACMFWV